jgi:hypothetical protein
VSAYLDFLMAAIRLDQEILAVILTAFVNCRSLISPYLANGRDGSRRCPVLLWTLRHEIPLTC